MRLTVELGDIKQSVVLEGEPARPKDIAQVMRDMCSLLTDMLEQTIKAKNNG